MEGIVTELFHLNAIKFGEFVLKSGLISPIYIDVRDIISYPDLIEKISDLMYAKMSKDVDRICGVPYGALALTSFISCRHRLRMVKKNKETKGYGTNKLVEGVFEKDMSCCIIEDVITTGSSLIDTAKALENAGFRVSEAIVLIDRNQGARRNLNNHGITVKSVFDLHEVLELLLKVGKISQAQHERCTQFIEQNQVQDIVPVKSDVPAVCSVQKTLTQRVTLSNNAVTRRLLTIIDKKKTKLCLAADVKTMAELLSLAEKVAPFICILKLHTDTIDDFDLESIKRLKEIAVKHDFLLMEDRKLADIGNTTKLQVSYKHFEYFSWCDLITVHAIAGDGLLDAIKLAAHEKNVDIGCVIVAEMSCKGSWSSAEYKKHCADMAEQHSDIVTGFVTQSLVRDNLPGFVHFTPGVKLSSGGDSLGQNYRSVGDLKQKGFVDVFIVGRGITESASPDREAALYRDQTFI